MCDLHGYIEELATYLYQNQLLKYIERYLEGVNPNNTPKFVGTLIDLDCSEDFIKGLLSSVTLSIFWVPILPQIGCLLPLRDFSKESEHFLG